VQLDVEVHLPGEGESIVEETITDFAQIDRIANRVAGAVRRWLKATPVVKSGRRATMFLQAQWSEGQPHAARNGKPRSRRKAKAEDGTD